MFNAKKLNVEKTTYGYRASDSDNRVFEINVGIDEKTAGEIFALVAEHLQSNPLDVNCRFENKNLRCPLYLKTEDETTKIIFPDPLFRFPWDEGCFPEYKKQITV